VNMVVWITGVTGYTGRWLVQHIRETEPGVRIVGLARSAQADMTALDCYLSVDICDETALAEAVERTAPDCVYHLAALAPPARAEEMWRVNVGGTLNLLWALSLAGCRDVRIVCAGSAAEYLRDSAGPLCEESPAGGANEYGRSKWAQTSLALMLSRQLNLQVTIARAFNIIGPGLPERLVAGRICRQVVHPGSSEIRLRDLSPERDFIDIRDVVAAYRLLVERGTAGAIYNVCSGVATPIAELVAIFQDLANVRRKVTFQPSSSQEGSSDSVYGDNRRIRALGWRPAIPLARSVADMISWCRHHGDAGVVTTGG